MSYKGGTMMPRLLIKLCLFSIIWTQHFQVNLESTGQTQLTLFQSSITSLTPGDEIGIFDENGLTNYNNCNNEIGELLVGAGVWTGQQLSIVSIGSVDMCSFGGVQISGYVEGNPLKVKIYKPSTNLEYDAELTWSVGTGTFGDIIQSVSEIEIVDLYSCDDNNDAMSAFGGCENAVAALGCEFVFAGTPIFETCPITCDSCPAYGCLNENACNFDGNADSDDGSCWYANDGCSCDDGIHAEVDECGTCNGNGPEPGFDCDGNCVIHIDCEGVCGGDALEDNCGTCDSDNSNDCAQDCLGQWGGDAEYDNCGVCDGGDAYMDCAGTCSPSTPLGEYHDNLGMEYGARIDDCDVCSGGESGHIANSDMDECGVCFGDGIPDGDCDCYGNVFDECGECGGDGSDCNDDGGGGTGGDDGGWGSDCDGNEFWIGDGFCDIINNNQQCGYDGGDCCPGDCIDGTYSCIENGGDCYDCINPNSADNAPGGQCNDDGGGSDGSSVIGTSCGDGLIYDCAINCVNENVASSMIGDGICNDNNNEYFLNCPELDCDGGDCPIEYCDDDDGGTTPGEDDIEAYLSFGDLGGVVLTTLEIGNVSSNEICISAAILSGNDGHQLNVEIGNCLPFYEEYGNVDIYLLNLVDVGGFQFEITGADIFSASGGAASDAGFMTSASGSTTIGFSLTGSSIGAQDDDGGGDEGETEISYENDIQPIFNANCTSYCHSGGGNYAGGLDLTSYENLMAGTNAHGLVVNPGYADYSILIQKLSDNPPFGQQMPLNQPPLEASLVDLIAEWINAGAIGPDDSGPEEDIYGCTDPTAENYNPDATIEDGSCTYPPLGELGFSNYQMIGDGTSTIDIELDCEYAVNEVEISLSGVEIVDALGIESLENEDITITPSFILWSSTSTEIPSHSGAIMRLVFTTPFEDASLCFENSNIVTTVGIEYPAILGDCAQIPAGGLLTSIDIVPGWNWLSINLESTDMSLDNVFGSINGSASYLKSQNAYAEYYYGYGWWGTLETVSNIEMYKLIASQNNNITFEGTPVDVNSTSIPLTAGWNWIGYLPQSPLPINTALSSIDGVGTYIKNQTIYADYFDGYGWWGTLQELEPNNGYMLSTISDGELEYPSDEVASVSPEVEGGLQRQTNAYHQFEFNGSATIEVKSDEINIGENDYIIAYLNGENRGEVKAVENPFSESFVFPLMIHGDGEFIIEMKLYSHHEQIEYNLYPQVHYSPDMVKGNAVSPLILKTQSSELNIPHEFVVSPAYPNPFNPQSQIEFGIPKDSNVEINVLDVSGRKIETIMNSELNAGYHHFSWNGSQHSSGIYIIQIKSEFGTNIQKLMLIK